MRIRTLRPATRIRAILHRTHRLCVQTHGQVRTSSPP